MKRCLAVLLVLCVAVAGTARAEVEIDPENYVANKDDGYCAWACLKTLALHHDIRDLARVIIEDEAAVGTTYRDKYDPKKGWIKVPVPPGGASASKLKKRLDGYVKRGFGFRYKMQSESKSLALIRESLASGYGCMVTTQRGKHAVTVVDLTTEKETWKRHDGTTFQDYSLKYIDSNDVSDGRKSTRYMALSWFTRNEWDGLVVMLYPHRRTAARGSGMMMRPGMMKRTGTMKQQMRPRTKKKGMSSMRPKPRPAPQRPKVPPPRRVAPVQSETPPLEAPVPMRPLRPGKPIPPTDEESTRVQILIAPALTLPKSKFDRPRPR